MNSLESIAQRYAVAFHGPVADPTDSAPDGFPPQLQRVLLARARLVLVAAAFKGRNAKGPASFLAGGIGFVATIDADDVLRVRLEDTGDLVAKSMAGMHDTAQALLTTSLKGYVDGIAKQAEACSSLLSAMGKEVSLSRATPQAIKP